MLLYVVKINNEEKTIKRMTEEYLMGISGIM